MKNLISVLLISLSFISLKVNAQKIKILSSYEKNEQNGTRYVALLSDNSIYWFMPGNAWKKSTTDGLPTGYNIIQFTAYEKNEANGTRYVAVLSDGSIYWFMPNNGWKKSSTEGLPN